MTSEKAQDAADRDWWRKAGDVLNLELKGWTYRIDAQFSDRETDQTVYLTGAMAARLAALSPRLSPTTALLTEAADALASLTEAPAAVSSSSVAMPGVDDVAEPEAIDWYDVDPADCPRCGSDRTFLNSYFRPDSAEVCRVECRPCGFRGREEFDPETAITDWNAMERSIATPAQAEAEPAGWGLIGISADIESKRVLKLHYDHEATDADRKNIVDAFNALNRGRRATPPAPSAAAESDLASARQGIEKLKAVARAFESGLKDQPPAASAIRAQRDE